jgi:hypothetical protein
MTYAEIKSRLWELYNNYGEQGKSLTSVQRPAFNARFAKDNNVVVNSGYGFSISFSSPIVIDDVGVVENVWLTEEEIGWWTKNKKKYPHIALRIGMKTFAFSTKSRSAFQLKKGDKIRITGKVKAGIYSCEDTSVGICPKSTFSINFFKL